MSLIDMAAKQRVAAGVEFYVPFSCLGSSSFATLPASSAAVHFS